MTAAEGSYFGIAIQDTAGTPETTDDKFLYMLLMEGAIAPNNVIIPLPPEVGGGALPRGVVKVAVNSGAVFRFIPRPDSIGMLFNGMTGNVTSTRNLRQDCVLADHACDGSTHTTPIGQPSVATKLAITGVAGGVGDVVITGTVGGVPAQTDTVTITGATTVESTKLFSAIASIAVPTDAGKTVDVGWYDGSYTHVFKLDQSDQFAAPYYTARSLLSIGVANDWGEVFQDCRPNMLSLEWKAPGFVFGTSSFVGGLPAPADASAWAPYNYIDAGPQFLTSPGNVIQVPTGTNLSVISGSFACGSAIPLDEQYKVGSYVPEGLDIVSRAFGLQLQVKVTDEVLYHKMQYDPNAGNAWLPEIFSDGRIVVGFESDQDAAAVKLSTESLDVRPYSWSINANNQAGDSANVKWAMTPISLRAQRQVIANIQGTFLASPNPALDPVTITLVNRRASYAYA